MDYLFVYHSTQVPVTEADRAASNAAWGAWLRRHAAHFPDPGLPATDSVTVTADGLTGEVPDRPATGYTLVDTPDLETAAAIAAENPMVAAGHGTIEIARLLPVTL